jgi:hypothetical protein
MARIVRPPQHPGKPENTMSKEPREPLLNYWYQALAAAHGIELACSEAESVRAALYVARREAQDVDLAQIKVTISPFDPTKIWLVKKESQDATS